MRRFNDSFQTLLGLTTKILHVHCTQFCIMIYNRFVAPTLLPKPRLPFSIMHWWSLGKWSAVLIAKAEPGNNVILAFGTV